MLQDQTLPEKIGACRRRKGEIGTLDEIFHGISNKIRERKLNPNPPPVNHKWFHKNTKTGKSYSTVVLGFKKIQKLGLNSAKKEKRKKKSYK